MISEDHFRKKSRMVVLGNHDVRFTLDDYLFKKKCLKAPKFILPPWVDDVFSI